MGWAGAQTGEEMGKMEKRWERRGAGFSGGGLVAMGMTIAGGTGRCGT